MRSTRSISSARQQTSQSYRRDEASSLPDGPRLRRAAGLSNEVRQKLGAHRPRTIGQAGRLDGVTPAALTLLARHMRRSERASPARTRRSDAAARARHMPGPCRPRGGSRAGRWSLSLFHVKQRSVSTASSRLLVDWQQRINLIAASTVPHIWTRHVADSLQLLRLRQARIWVDLGSGGGFPGLPSPVRWPTAGAQRPPCREHGKKAAFLREACRPALPAIVHRHGSKTLWKRLRTAVDIVTARALAPLARTAGLCVSPVENGG